MLFLLFLKTALLLAVRGVLRRLLFGFVTVDDCHEILSVVVFLELLVFGDFGDVDEGVLEGEVVLFGLDDFHEGEVFGEAFEAFFFELSGLAIFGAINKIGVVLLDDHAEDAGLAEGVSAVDEEAGEIFVAVFLGALRAYDLIVHLNFEK